MVNVAQSFYLPHRFLLILLPQAGALPGVDPEQRPQSTRPAPAFPSRDRGSLTGDTPGCILTCAHTQPTDDGYRLTA